MKRFILPALAVAFTLALAPSSFSADAKTQLQELVEKVKTKLKAGQKTEAELADEIKAFDTILNEHKGEKTDDVAQVLFMKALLYAEVFKNDDKADEGFAKLQADFPETGVAKQVAAQAESRKLQNSLKPGAAFPAFEEKDLDGKTLSIANYKGKVVLIDFWATWCGPCVAELPNVLKAYETYHAKGFEIIGISLDQSKDKLTAFTAEKKMPWPQFFDGQGWKNKLAVQYGVNSIPATYLLDKEGKIIAKGLRGAALEEALAKALQ